jgi:hypothetical protein
MGNRLFPIKDKLRASTVSSAARLSISLHHFFSVWTRGFVPPGYPGFTFSETTYYRTFKEQRLLILSQLDFLFQYYFNEM